MGTDISAYHVYGVHVPDEQWIERAAPYEGEKIETVLKRLKDVAPDVSYLTAGAYDRDMLFLCIHEPDVPSEVRIGSFRIVRRAWTTGDIWDAQLKAVADAMGYKDLGEPGWITVPDES